MIRRQPSSKRTATLFPYTTLFRSALLVPPCAPLIGPLGGDPQGWPFARRKSASRQTLRPDSPEASMRDQLFSHPGGAHSWIYTFRPNTTAKMAIRSTERRVGKECVRQFSSRWEAEP